MDIKSEIRHRLFKALGDEDEKYLIIARRKKSFFAVPFEYVREVIPPPPIKLLPLSPPFLKGIISHFGRIVPILEISEFIKIDEPEMRRVMTFLVSDGHYIAGILINEYPEFKKIEDEGEIFPVQTESEENLFLRGFVKEGESLLPILDVPLIFEEVRKRIKRW
jgi:purine-binding chemotaxis protein CheW